ncbi:hypothetical protein [Curtanaerobium respiraculi]|uniref:hypothetical protein n=1 Tax=Curtanaerobium respiraculi TaxID=2949669 RepID=UPI0024B3582F|nr:hypothetical protein [Curtanaerobium respiraculi]
MMRTEGRRVLARVLLCCALVMACAVALVGCGKGYVGTWEVTEVNPSGGVWLPAKVTNLDGATLVLNEDGSCELNWFDKVDTGTWKMSEADQVAVTLDDGKDMLLEPDGDSLVSIGSNVQVRWRPT